MGAVVEATQCIQWVCLVQFALHGTFVIGKGGRGFFDGKRDIVGLGVFRDDTGLGEGHDSLQFLTMEQ